MTMFPDDIPPNCPFPEATPGNRTVYFATQRLAFDASDFRTAAQRGRFKGKNQRLVCQSHGLSVFPSMETCAHMIKLYPAIGPHVVKAHLSPEHGVIAATPSNVAPAHHTWWPFKLVARETLFAPV